MKFNKCTTKEQFGQWLQSEAGGAGGPMAVTINAEIQGYIPAAADNGSQQSIYGYPSYDAATHGAVPTIESAFGHNPQCDGEGNSIGTLVINPLLPAGSSDTFDLTTTMLDNSGGGGGVFLFCPATGEYTPYQSNVSSSFGNNTGPVTQTHTLDASYLSCAIEDVRIGIAAWGVSSDYDGDPRCDELSTEIGTLVVVTPSECAPALTCFETLFGCSFFDMMSQPGSPLAETAAKIESLQFPIYRLSSPENGMLVDAWFDNDGKAAPHPAGLNTVPEVDDFIDSVWNGTPTADGIPGHVNGAPSTSIVFDTSSNFNDNTAFPDGEGSGLDQYKIQTYIDTTGLGDVDLFETNANSGEAGRIYLSTCCGPLQVAGHILDTPPYEAGQFGTAIPEGIHCVTALLSDRSVFGGFHIQYRPTGTENWINVPVARLFTAKREVECQLIAGCDVIPEGWSLEQPKLCSPSPTVASSGGAGLDEAAVVALIGDNDPTVELCEGPFHRATAKTSWWNGWTPIITANQGTSDAFDWVNLGSSEVSPDCVTDVTIKGSLGYYYHRIRRCRAYQWVDVRLLIDGAPVYTETNCSYHYDDELEDTNPDVIRPVPVDIDYIGSYVGERVNVPPRSTLQLQVKVRYNVNGAQSSAYYRSIWGLRSKMAYDFERRDQITGVTH